MNMDKTMFSESYVITNEWVLENKTRRVWNRAGRTKECTSHRMSDGTQHRCSWIQLAQHYYNLIPSYTIDQLTRAKQAFTSSSLYVTLLSRRWLRNLQSDSEQEVVKQQKRRKWFPDQAVSSRSVYRKDWNDVAWETSTPVLCKGSPREQKLRHECYTKVRDPRCPNWKVYFVRAVVKPTVRISHSVPSRHHFKPPPPHYRRN